MKFERINVEEAESDDESIENLEDIAPCKKTRERSPIQCSRPPKLRTSSSSSKGGDAKIFYYLSSDFINDSSQFVQTFNHLFQK